jgi:hypothetical protein
VTAFSQTAAARNTASGAISSAEVGIAAFGIVQAAQDELARLRKQPGQHTAKTIAPGLLRHADEQTVLGLAAVLRAIQDFGWQDHCFRDWGVLAAPRFLGRGAIAAALAQYPATGARGVSPLIIPHFSLHAVSATISLALGIHGPNFGIGGGPGNLAEGILTALSVVQDGDLPGLWLVVTGWEPEPCFDEAGKCTSQSVCQAVALALVPVVPDWPGTRLRRTSVPLAGGHASILSNLIEFLKNQNS